MTDEDNFEAQLRQALRAKASRAPETAVERLQRLDYHPRTRRMSPAVALSAIGGAGLATGGVITAVLLTTATPAFAGWTAQPTTSTSAQTATAATSCQAQLGSLPGSNPAGDWSDVGTDVRGPYTLTVYQDGAALATCLTGPSFSSMSESSGLGHFTTQGGSFSETQRTRSQIGTSVSMFDVGGSGSLERFSMSHLDVASQGPYTVVDGEVASEVSALTLVRSDGTDVQASVADEWFLAWWPGSAGATTAELTTQAGTTSQPLPTAASGPSGTSVGPAATSAPAATTTAPSASTNAPTQ